METGQANPTTTTLGAVRARFRSTSSAQPVTAANLRDGRLRFPATTPVKNDFPTGETTSGSSLAERGLSVRTNRGSVPIAHGLESSVWVSRISGGASESAGGFVSAAVPRAS